MTLTERSIQSVHIYTLGRFHVEVAGVELRHSPNDRDKSIDLLKLLAAQDRGSAPISQINAALWPALGDQEAYQELFSNVEGLCGLIGREALRLDKAHIALNADQIWVDAHALAHELTRSGQAVNTGDGSAAFQHVGNALAYYGGPFLHGDLDLPEILAARVNLNTLLVQEVLNTGEFLRITGQVPMAIELYEKGLEADGQAEEIYQNLMGCYAQAGRAEETRALYERCRHTLQASAGREPSPKTTAIFRGIQASLQNQPGPAAAHDPSVQRPAEAPVDPPAGRGGTPGERRNPTIVFSDLSGYTALNELLDPEDVEQIMSRIWEEAERIVTSRGGIVNQIVGDEVVALFGIPTANEDDTRQAVLAALDLHAFVRHISTEVESKIGRTLRMHTGISWGLTVMHRQDDHAGRYKLVGETVNFGARLAGLARSDEVLLSPAVQHLVARYFKTEPQKATTPKGMAQPIVPYLVEGESGIEDRFHAEEQRGFTPYTGREREAAVLQELLEKAVSGKGQIVTVAGDAGMGKSRLLHEFRGAQQGKPVGMLRGRCQHHARNTPYFPFITALRRGIGLNSEDPPEEQLQKAITRIVGFGPELEAHLPVYLHLLSLTSEKHALPPGIEGAGMRDMVKAAMAAVLRCVVGLLPTILQLESWHWADEASVEIVNMLIELIEDNPILVIITYRPGRSFRWDLGHNHTHLALEPLGTHDTAQIVASVLSATNLPPGMVDVIHGQTGGNPFFVEELCRVLREDGILQVTDGLAELTCPLDELRLPDTVEAVVRARLDQLNDATKEVLRLASISGMEFSRAVLDLVHPRPEELDEFLEALKNLKLIQQPADSPEGAYRFSHAITQQVVYKTLLLRRRKALHLRVGEAIESLYANWLEEHVEALAHHFSNSTAPERAIGYLQMAGLKAASYFSLVEARAHLWSAMDVLGSLEEDPERMRKRIEITMLLARISFFSPSPKLAEALQMAAQDATALGDQAAVADCVFRSACINYGLGNYAEAAAQLEAGPTLARPGPSPELNSLATNYLGRVKFYLADFEGSASDLRLGIEALEQAGERLEAANSMGILASALAFQGKFEECAPLAGKITEIVEQADNPALRAMAYLCSGLAEDMRGNWAEAARYLADSEKLSRQVGNDIMAGVARWCLGYAVAMPGDMPDDIERGIAIMDEGIEIIEQAKSRFALNACRGMAAEVHALAGKNKTAKTLATKALELAAEGADKTGVPAAHRALALYHSSKKGHSGQKAQEHIQESLRIAKESGGRTNLAIGYFRFAGILANAGEVKAAIIELSEAEKMFQEMGMDWWSDEARRLRTSLA